MSEDVPPPATKRPGRTPRLSDAECREIAAEFDGTTPPSTRCLCAGSCDTPACDATTSSRRRVAAATSLRRRAAAGRRARTTSCARTGSACPGPRSRPPSVAASLRSGCAGAVCSSAGTKATRARPAAVRRDGVLGAAGCAPDPSTCCGSPVSRYGDSARYAARDPGEGDVVRTQARQRGLEGHDPASRLRARVSAQENLWLSTLGWPKAPA